MGTLSRAGGFRGRSPSPSPMITKHLLLEKHYSEQDGQDPCPCGALRGGCEVIEREEEGIGDCRCIYNVYPDFSEPSST